MRTPPSRAALGRRIAVLAAALVCVAAGCGSDAAARPGEREPSQVTDSDASSPAESAESAAGPSIGGTSNGAVTPYETGAFSGTDVWVDPVAGDDAADGRSRSTALRSVAAAWQRIPAGVPLDVGMRIMLAPGTYPVDGSVNYWEDKHGTASAPIVLEAADGPHTVTFEADMNVFDVSYLYVLGVDIVRDGDAFHCERCDHVLIRDAELSGATDPSSGGGAHETVKVNQSQHIYIERSDIHGADDNAIDFVAVQYAHVIDSRIHGALDWCMYAKGGSAYIDVAGNEVFDCGTGGITAGQGTGFEFMSAPWIRYEAYGVRITDNVIHDIEGAGLGVNGGFDVLLADNTLYRVGARSHVIEIVHGRRGCDGIVDACAAHLAAGGWGTTGEEQGVIPSRHVYVYDNVVVNPDGAGSQWQHFQIDAPIERAASGGTSRTRPPSTTTSGSPAT